MQALLGELTAALSPLGGEARAAAKALVGDVFDLSPTQVALAFDRPVGQADADRLLSMARRVAKGEPLQYVTGVSLFAGLRLSVGPGVLIPRPETEGLVDLAVGWASGRKGLRVLDIGTGSGCIALSLRHSLCEPEVMAVDASDDALRTARANAQRLGLDVDIASLDILSPQADALAASGPGFDIVVSNPPYVRLSERAHMEANVLDHEPAMALFVPDDDPLLFYRRIGQLCARGLLAPRGALFFEINEALGRETADMLAGLGLSDVKVCDDFTGRHRFVRASLPDLNRN